MLKILFLALLLGLSLNTFSQDDMHNYFESGTEYLNFRNQSPCFVCEYNFKQGDNIEKYGLYIEYNIYNIFNPVGYPMIYEFRTNTSFLIILGFMENAYRIRVMDKLVIPFWKKPGRDCIEYGCEYKKIEDSNIFGFFEDKDSINWLYIPRVQYYIKASKAWKVNRVDLNNWKFQELTDLSNIRSYNEYYMDFTEDYYESNCPYIVQPQKGIINNPDGYVNVRKRPSENGEVISKLLTDTEFKYWEDKNYDWWLVENTKGKRIYGFVQKARLKEK